MSKKNKNKFKNANPTAPAATQPSAAGEAATKQQTAPADDLLKEFKHLAIVIIFILALLFVINYYNEKDGILQSFSDRFYSLF